ncbi:hypothetical protein BKA62DRAFT_45671 [Auriculariales sp. MPI-PUGE-AT-0066]|nr:hypothetical protein BKA62DRAFT_45671 [Auriculariales sp. MPI-PUGE-AT-0066]
MGYALWLVPSDAEMDELRALMEFRPPQRRHTDAPSNRSRSYPHFEPHITVANFAHLPNNFKLESIVPDGNDLGAHFTSLERGDSYLGAMKLVMTASEGLITFRADIIGRLRRIGVENNSRRFPHLSLFYVDEADERSRLFQELQERGFVTNPSRNGRLTIKGNPRSDGPGIDHFTGVEVWLVNCVPRDVEKWRVLQKVNLTKPLSPERRAVNWNVAPQLPHPALGVDISSISTFHDDGDIPTMNHQVRTPERACAHSYSVLNE